MGFTARGGVVSALLCVMLGNSAAHAQSLERPSGKAQASAKAAAQDKRGTDESPLTIKILPAPDAQAKAADEQKERDKKAVAEAEKALLDHALVEWTRRLFWATFALAAFAAVQIGLFWWQLRLIARGAGDAAKAANAAKSAAEAAVDVARPVLFPVVVFAPEFAEKMPSGQMPKIYFAFENYGKGVAIIRKVTSEVVIHGERLPEVRQFTGDSRNDLRPVLIAGEHRIGNGSRDDRDNFLTRVSRQVTADDWAAAKGNPPTKHFFLVGSVYYDDLFGFEYETGFAVLIFKGKDRGIRGGGDTFNYYRYQKKPGPT